jgi:hypothetical protein
MCGVTVDVDEDSGRALDIRRVREMVAV